MTERGRRWQYIVGEEGCSILDTKTDTLWGMTKAFASPQLLEERLNEDQAEPEVNKSDATDCEACSVIERGQCLFHEGVAVGVEVAKRAILAALDGDL